MPLPSDSKAAWPPKAWVPILDTISESAAWYSGDPAALAARYGHAAPRNERPRFWSRDTASGKIRQKLHVPAAADIATTSADLLFGETPAFTVPEAHEDQAEGDAKATQDRMDELAEQMGLANTLLEAAEVASGLGGVYLRAGWDADVVERPLLDVVHADHAIPVWRSGVLTQVTFWRTLTVDKGSSVWRHLECHEPGMVTHGLFVGTKDTIGVQVPLDRHPETADFAGESGDGVVATPDGIDGLLVRYVPNVLPNRKHRGDRVGRADTAGTEPLMDALDETYTSWIRDIRVGQARIIVPSEFLNHRGRGKGAEFDLDQEVFSPLEMDPSAMSEGSVIKPVEFLIRTREHAETAAALFEQIISPAGYDGQTFGLHSGGSSEKTATEVRAREGRTLRTTGKKRRYCGPEISDMAEMLLVIDREIFGTQVTPMRPRVDFDDGLVEDPHRTAETLELFRRARAMSVETAVRMASPNLGPDEVDAEVARIRAEEGLTLDDPTGGFS